MACTRGDCHSPRESRLMIPGLEGSRLSVLADPANPVELLIVSQLREFLSDGDEPLVPIVIFCAIERRRGFGVRREDRISRLWRGHPPLLARKSFARLVGNDR